MALYVYWFLLALVLLGLEMVTGTFYLLMLSGAMAVGGFAALLGASVTWQLTLCAAAAVAGAIVLRRRRSVRADGAGASLDVGQPVQVLNWLDNGSARVSYRGAEWDAEPESPDTPRDAALYIKAVRGSTLVLTHRKEQHD
jgi:membrane protein implicated in regulation of membrane protease activity